MLRVAAGQALNEAHHAPAQFLQVGTRHQQTFLVEGPLFLFVFAPVECGNFGVELLVPGDAVVDSILLCRTLLLLTVSNYLRTAIHTLKTI